MIYVDYLQTCNPNSRWRWDQVSHLHCLPTDDIEELHQFAERIGLLREWFQPQSIIPHYDLMPATREIALRAGAVELHTRWELVVHIRAWRTHRYGKSGAKDQG